MGVVKGFLKNGVSVSHYISIIYEYAYINRHVRDAEVAGSNPVAPIDVNIVSRKV